MSQHLPDSLLPIGTLQHGWPAAHEADALTLVRSVTGAVVSVTAALKRVNALLAEETRDHAALARAVASLNYAVADQRQAAGGVLERLTAEIVPSVS